MSFFFIYTSVMFIVWCLAIKYNSIGPHCQVASLWSGDEPLLKPVITKLVYHKESLSREKNVVKMFESYVFSQAAYWYVASSLRNVLMPVPYTHKYDPGGARPSAGTILATNLYRFSTKFLWLSAIDDYWCLQDDIVKNGWRDSGNIATLPVLTISVAAIGRFRGKTKSALLRWRHNGPDGVSNHQPHDCLLNRLFRRRSKKTPKLRVTGLCVGNAENVSTSWRHHDHGSWCPRPLRRQAISSHGAVCQMNGSLSSKRHPRHCPACRTSLIATRFWVVMICPIIKCLTVLEFSFILFDLCLFITIFNLF